MTNNFKSATQKIQDLMTLYSQLDNAPNRGQWHFDSQYDNANVCAFVFSHTTTDISKRSETLNMLANILFRAGIKSSIIAKDGMMSDIVIAPEYTDLARKLFNKYQSNSRGESKSYNMMLEQEWLNQRHK